MRPSLLAIALGAALVGSFLASIFPRDAEVAPTGAVIRAPVSPIPCQSTVDCPMGSRCEAGACAPRCPLGCVPDGRCEPCIDYENCPLDPDCP